MNKFFRAVIAAWRAKKLAGGCLSTFVIIYLLFVNATLIAVQILQLRSQNRRQFAVAM
jgi:DNA-directed RNA polymerase subunit K/omega